jgi:hypothetical protein
MCQIDNGQVFIHRKRAPPFGGDALETVWISLWISSRKEL